MAEFINRPEYLNQLIQHKDVHLVKIVTSIRRCGKSSLLDLFHQYISMLRSAFIFYSVGRYDVKGRQLLKTLGKNYIIDMGFRNMLLGYRDAVTGNPQARAQAAAYDL